MTLDLFADADDGRPAQQAIAPGALLLPRFALAHECALLAALQQVLAIAPFRPMTTPGGTRSPSITAAKTRSRPSTGPAAQATRREPSGLLRQLAV